MMGKTLKDQPKEKSKPKFQNSRNNRMGGVVHKLKLKYSEPKNEKDNGPE